jgi:hypothetical protein
MASVGGDVVGAEQEVTLDGVSGERTPVDEVVEIPCRDAQPAGGLPAGEPVLVLASVGPSHFHDISLYHGSEGCERAPGQALSGLVADRGSDRCSSGP